MTTTSHGVTLEAAAQLLTVSVRTLQRMHKRGKIRFARLGSRVVVPASEVDRLLGVGEFVDVSEPEPIKKVELFPRARA